ncbi:hypothetical protein UPYG_G00253000 [Umbra pygmaea]|uniref:Adhesion G protein-coupled receptor F5 n=1 Tax=Umbra pygmaea TaxID=75934 RepID=A0ABD0WT93_UMBPY
MPHIGNTAIHRNLKPQFTGRCLDKARRSVVREEVGIEPLLFRVESMSSWEEAWRRPRTRWRDYISTLAWENLGIPQSNLVLNTEEYLHHVRSKREVALIQWNYIIEVEVNVSSIETMQLIMSDVYSSILPFTINNSTEISEVNITTVCNPESFGYQCRCEDQYLLSCDQCRSLGSCDNITSETCGCINAIPPDGQYCQSVLEQNVTSCSTTTAFPITDSTIQQILYTYRIDVELNTTDVATINTILTDLGNEIYPVMINNMTDITGANITTVCNPESFGYQCRCEDQYLLSCDQCRSLGSCDNITSETCGCINAIPPDGQYCQSVLQQNVTSCSTTTAFPITDSTIQQILYTYRIDVELNTTDVATINTILTDLGNESYPVMINNMTDITGANITTVCNLNSIGYQCRCEDQYLWSCDQCESYGSCDNITSDTCECINAIPPDGQFCQSVLQQNFATCPATTASPATDITSLDIYFGLNLNFTSDLKNKSSATYMMYKSDIEGVIQDQYKSNLPGYISATLTDFSPGSVIVTFNVQSRAPNLTQIINADNGIENSLPAAYPVIPNSFVIINNPFTTAPPPTTTQTTTIAKTTTTANSQNGVLEQINNLAIESLTLTQGNVESFLEKLSNVANDLQVNIAQSPATISSIVDILGRIAELLMNINQKEIQNILQTVDVLISSATQKSWNILNSNATGNTSSSLLGSLETFAGVLPNQPFNLTTNTTQLNVTNFKNTFNNTLNGSVLLTIPTMSTGLTITTLTFSTLNNVLPARNGSNNSVNDNIINAEVVLVKLKGDFNNVSFSFNKLNKSLTFRPQCVFWNFSLFENRGGWDNKGCNLVSDMNGNVMCHCDHLTSFSVLFSTSIPADIAFVLDIITYVGVTISMVSLVLCLIIEAFIWTAATRNSTSYIRHVCIVNIAVSLLIADIWFIIGSAITNAEVKEGKPLIPACTAATFFIHFFYLSMFFWMLISALHLFYKTIMVFSHMSKCIMLAIGFSVGYGAPFIIAVVTIASTASYNGYVAGNLTCWLNWDKTKALLAFVIPVLSILIINFLILIVVLYKMLRRDVGGAAQSDDRNAAMVVIRCLIILTPIFGLTWGLGIGTLIAPSNRGIQITFSLFNSLQVTA